VQNAKRLQEIEEISETLNYIVKPHDALGTKSRTLWYGMFMFNNIYLELKLVLLCSRNTSQALNQYCTRLP